MAMNPANVFKLMQMKKKFEHNHPKAVSFVQRVLLSGLLEGSVVEMSVTKPGEDKVTTNIRVTADDLEMMEELKNLNH